MDTALHFHRKLQPSVLAVINRDLVGKERYQAACMRLCRVFRTELKAAVWRGREKQLAGLLAGYWRPRPKKRSETQADAYRREKEEAKADVLLKMFDPEARATSQRTKALFHILDLCRTMPVNECQRILGPQFWRCCSCGKAFFAETRRGYRAYCDGGKCGSAATARKRVEKVRAGKHAELLRLAAKELGRMAGGPNAKERLAAKIAVTPKWITRQINSGQLVVPGPLRPYLYPMRAKTADVRKGRPGRSSFTPHPLPTRAIGNVPGWKIVHENYDSLEGDRNAIERFNEFLAELAGQ